MDMDVMQKNAGAEYVGKGISARRYVDPLTTPITRKNLRGDRAGRDTLRILGVRGIIGANIAKSPITNDTVTKRRLSAIKLNRLDYTESGAKSSGREIHVGISACG